MGFKSTDNVAASNASSHFSNTGLEKHSIDVRAITAKRVLDIAIAIVGLSLTAPLILVVGILIKMQDGGNPIFSQARYGLSGQTFMCFKLRSMVVDAQERLDNLLATDPAAKAEWDETQKLRDDPRITRLGQFIRKTSIDELPQLFNVLRGDMSIVGPRPIVQNEIVRYGQFFKDYTSVRPGITGLWQVEGRSNTTYEERVMMDVTYAKTQSFFGDVMIILKTIPAVLLSRGAV